MEEQLQGIPEAKLERIMRRTGQLVLGAGVIIFTIFGGWPIYQAKTGAHEVSYSMKLIGLGIGLIFIGLNLAIFGKKAWSWLPSNDTNLKWPHMLFLLINVILAGGAMCGMGYYLEHLGYVAKH